MHTPRTRGPMHTPRRRSASPHIDRLRPLTPSARALLQSLPPCASRGHFASRPMAVARLAERAQRTGSFAGLTKRTQPAERNRQLSRRLAERTRRADQSPFARRTRQPVPLCLGEPDHAHRHDLSQTNPRAQTRRGDEPDRADQARKAATQPCGIMAKRTGEAAHVRLGGNGRLGRTNPEAAARTKPVHSPSRLNPPTRLSVENSPVFFLLFTGKPIFALAAVVPALSLREDQSVAEPRSERTRGAKLTRQPGYFGRTNPRRQAGQHLAKRSQGAAPSRPWPNKPKGHRVTISAKRTQAADQSASSPNEPDEQPSQSCFRQMNPRCSPVPVWAK
jgi:hypothetical protein